MLRIDITDPGDERVADYVGLRDHDLRLRRGGSGGDVTGRFLAEGDVVVERALRAGYHLRSVLIDATRTQPLPAAVPTDAPVYAAGPELVKRITGMGVHRGMMATFDRRAVPPATEVLGPARRVVVLEAVMNPTNLGVVARSAAALGIDALALDPATVDPLYRRASRVAMGEVFGLDYCRIPPLPAGLDLLRELGFELLALTPAPSAVPLDALGLESDDRVALVLGSEGPGLREESLTGVVERGGRLVRIPIADQVDSLNVAAAAAIACYELGRR